MRMSFCQFIDELSPEVEIGVEADPIMDNVPMPDDVEPINDDLPDEVTGEVEVVIHPHDEDSQDDIINLGDSGLEAVTDLDDPGFEIVTEEKGTNCPSLSGSLRKDPKKKCSKGQVKDSVEDPKTEESKQHPAIKKWSKLMKYTLPSKNPESKQNKKNKERKSLKDKMKENEFVAFLTERRAVSESRFRVMDKLGEPGQRLVKTKSQQSLDEAWSTGITSGTIKSLKQRFEHDEELIFDLQTPVIVKDATSSTGDLVPQEGETKVADDEEADGLDNNDEANKSSGSSNAKINETPQDSGNDDKKKDKRGKKKEKKKCETCSSDKEHKEHRREKRRIKKEKQERKKEKEASLNNLTTTKASVKTSNGNANNLTAPPVVASVNIENVKHKITGDNFFQKLLMKDDGLKYPRVERVSRPLKKDKKYVHQPSEPAMGKYLKGKKAVSESKFKQFEEFEMFVEHSLLPRGIIKCEEFNEKKSVFEAGSQPPRSYSSLGGRVSPRTGSGDRERPASVMSTRSVSGDRRCFSLPRPGSSMSQTRPGSSMSQARPGSSMSQASNSSFIIDQQEYKNYVYEIINSAPKNPRFNQLTQYFSTLERVTKLESESSAMDVHKLKSDDIVDFETWRQLRKQEKATEELNELLVDLRKAQKEREFHFRPKEVDSVRWRGDSRLRGRDKSVENLKNLFSQKASEEQYASPSGANSNKDVYKLYWRPKSVTDLSKESEPPLENKFQSLGREERLKPSKIDGESRFTTYPKSRNVPSPYHAAFTEKRSRSSLSMDQVSAVKAQLNEILSAKNSNASSVQSSRSPSRADNFSVEVKGKGEPHPLQNLGLFVKPIPDVVKKSVAEAEKNQATKVVPRSRSQEEEERKRLSKTINEELLKKVNFHQEVNKKRINFDLDDTKSSPRTCHSLERGVKKGLDESADDFILVLSDGEQKNDEVEETLDKWASAGESEDESRIDEIRKRMKGRISGLQSSQSSDSISSVGTVIYKGVRNKTNYFENIQTPIGQNDESDEKALKSKSEPKTISEIKKDLDELNEKLFIHESKSGLGEDAVIPANLVKEIRKSFENMKLPDPPSEEELRLVAAESELNLTLPPSIPQRSSSYRKSKCTKENVILSGSKTSLDKSSPQSKSACSIADNSKDEGYATFPNSPRKPSRPTDYLEKTYVPEKSISNVDLTDNENNGLDETFGKMHDKVHSLGNSNDFGDYGFAGYKSLPYALPKSGHGMQNRHKYNRAYLTIARAGDVKEKLMAFENKLDGKPMRSLPAVDHNYIRSRATNTARVVIRGQEVADTTAIKQRLEGQEKDKDLFDYCAGMLTKEKLKYFCKKVGHSKIISRMASLQKSAQVDDDDGFKKLNLKASAETEYISKYRSGEVEQMKTVFESAVTPLHLQSQPPPDSHFSWSTRLNSCED